MNKILINFNSSGIETINRFKELIKQNHNKIIVRLTEPGIRYFEKEKWYSFIDLIEEHRYKNITYYGCNFSNKLTELPLKFINYMFNSGPDLYKKDTMCKGLLEQCLNYSKKSKNIKKWDFLLGGKTEIKDWIFETIKLHPIYSTVFLTYYRDNVKSGYWSNLVKIPKNHTAETIYDRFTSLLRYSDLIDPEIYNQTFFTALIETVQHEDFGVFTEKTAKPIIAQRPFVVFGSPGQLKALQKLGFKTFSPVIDESYDLELTQKIRFKKVLDSMYELGKQDPLDVYEKLKETLQYNKKHFEENAWNDDFLTSIKNCNKKIDLNNFDY